MATLLASRTCICAMISMTLGMDPRSAITSRSENLGVCTSVSLVTNSPLSLVPVVSHHVYEHSS